MVFEHHPPGATQTKAQGCSPWRTFLRGAVCCFCLHPKDNKILVITQTLWRRTMRNRARKILLSFASVGFILGLSGVWAQEPADHLVISQVYLSGDHPSTSWIQVFNPCNKSLVLERFRLSNVKTINILPIAIQAEGGLILGAGESLFLCASDSSFRTAFNKPGRILEIAPLRHLNDGGFIALTTKGAAESKGGVVRYGRPEMSSQVSKVAGSQVLPFSAQGRSFTRKTAVSGDALIVEDFIESPTTKSTPNQK